MIPENIKINGLKIAIDILLNQREYYILEKRIKIIERNIKTGQKHGYLKRLVLNLEVQE